jgi:hypothetical protein
VLWKESLDAGHWAKLADLGPSSIEQPVTFTDPLPPAAGRLYRLVTPQQPGPVNPMPAILASPQSIVTETGSDATFNVIAVGQGPLGYRWMFNGQDLGSATGPACIITNVQFTDVGLYSVTVTDTNGTETAGPAYLSAPPRIVVQPQSQSARPGDTVVFSVTAEGMGLLSYRWRREGHFLAGQTSSTLVLTNVQPAAQGRYSVTVLHQLPWGRFGIASSNAVLSILP